MAIEGPLRELGIHDVFSLLDLSRKTGVLRVVSALRDNEGMVAFEQGKVVHAEIRSNPHPLGQLLLRAGKLTESDLARARGMQTDRGDTRRLGDILVAIGAVSQRELDRYVRVQIEAVVFELMSWREGHFSFAEGGVAALAIDASARISTESLLMEGARRIDEWSRIADKLPSLSVIPTLAEVSDDAGGMMDLLPNEWAVLAAIDGMRDVRAIAAELAQSEFDVARVLYGLLSTGVVTVRRAERASVEIALPAGDASTHIHDARHALSAGRLDAALAAATRAVGTDGSVAEAQVVLGEVLLRVGRAADAGAALDRAAALDPLSPGIHQLRGTAAVLRGDLDAAVQAWGRCLDLTSAGPAADALRQALAAASQLRASVEALARG
jgi:Flp pilus assembly protein TadD